MPHKKNIFAVGTFALAVTLVSCATYQSNLREARTLLEEHKAGEAAKKIEKKALAEGKDQLIYLFDYATFLQQAGRYKESNNAYMMADQLAEWKDYTSLSKETFSLLFSEEMVQYKGENYEKVMINAMSAINFLMMKDLEGALVEIRRLNEKLEYFRIEKEKKYDQNLFAIYLGALLWEADKKWDDAYIDYKKAYQLAPSIRYLKEDLVRAAARAQRWDEYKKWKKEFQIKPKKEWKDPNYGELVVLYQQGWGPRKGPHPNSPRFPKLYPRQSRTRRARVIVEAQSKEIAPASAKKPASEKGASIHRSEVSVPIFSVQDVAIQSLDDAYAYLVAKRVAGIVAKEVVADQVRQKNETLGALMRIAMHVSDRADVRQWSTLPETFQVARLRLPKGEYQIRVEGLTISGSATGEYMNPTMVAIQPRKKTFVQWRSYE